MKCTQPVNVPDPSFKSPIFNESLNMGIDFVYQRSDRFQFYTGLGSGEAGYGFRFKVSRSNGYSRYTHNSGNTVNRFLLGMQYNIGKGRALYSRKRAAVIRDISPIINPKDVYYSLKFKFKLIGGFSLDHLYRHTDEGVPWIVRYYDPVAGQTDYYQGFIKVRPSRLGIAFFSGIAFNFYNLKKDHIQLTILYSQGLIRMATAFVTHGAAFDNGQGGYEYNTEIGVYGSYLSAQLSYPIRFKRQAK